MPRPQQDKIIDPEIREGVRIYVGTITDDENLSILAHLAPVQGQQMAYRMIYTAIKDSPQAVEKYDDEWLSDLMQEKVSA